LESKQFIAYFIGNRK